MISVIINGVPQYFDVSISIASLIHHMNMTGKRIAIELNGEIIPRSKFDTQMIFEGDRLEVVMAVGGG